MLIHMLRKDDALVYTLANEPFTDFADPANRELMQQAIAAAEAEFGGEYPRTSAPRP